MSQAKIKNQTALSYEILFANNEQFHPVVTPVIKATFDIRADGQLEFSKQQLPVNLEGEFLSDPESSSYIYEPECAFIKPSTDIVIIGDAISRKGPVSHLLVEIQVANLKKQIAVVGDRQWQIRSGSFTMSATQPFEKMPLTYENAFGGWDRRDEDPDKHGFEERNTVGKGYYDKEARPNDQPMWLPNLEDPNNLIQSITDRPQPMGSGFTLPHWQPRVAYAGTYDDAWQKNRSPLLPEDFDRRYFNAASEGLISNEYLLGNEAVRITNMTAEGELHFNLPGVKPPFCDIEFRDTESILSTYLDTVIINTRSMQLQLIWRNFHTLTKSPHDVEAIDICYG